MPTRQFTLLASVIVLIGFTCPVMPRASAQVAPAPIGIWDTKSASSQQLEPEDFEKSDAWQKMSRNQKTDSFQGDAVVTNGHILAVFRKQGNSVDVYSAGTGKPVWRVEVQLQGESGDPAAQLKRIALVEHTRSAARIITLYETAQGNSITAGFRIKRGGTSLEAALGEGAGQLRVEADGRFVVLPDFFADDILIDATKIPVDSAEIPSENFLLHLIGGGDAIAMCVFENNDQDVRITFDGEGENRTATGTNIRFGEDRKIWVSITEGPGIWHAFDVAEEDAGKVMPLGWKMPFSSQWRLDFTRNNDLTDSWEMLYPAEDGEGFIKPSWLPSGPRGGKPSLTSTGEIDVDAYKVGGPASNRLASDRKRWITVLGRYQYPCWTDEDGQGFVQPLDNKKLKFRGSAVIYPINRLPATPLDTFTTVDVVRETLGVGPCEHLLSVEGQRQDHVGRATCHVRRLLNEIYQSKQQKVRQKDIEIYLADALEFVKHIRDRIELYIDFGREMRAWLAVQEKAHPELAEPLKEMQAIVSELDTCLEARSEGIKSVDYVVALNDGFRNNLLGYEGPDSLKRLKTYTDSLTRVGGSQDGLVGECRWVVRTLRQRAALAMAVDPRFAAIAKEIRARTQKVLLKPSAYEGARH
jgi:protein-tyrosine-phosphatase